LVADTRIDLLDMPRQSNIKLGDFLKSLYGYSEKRKFGISRQKMV
jgi:hypothetical protein